MANVKRLAEKWMVPHEWDPALVAFLQEEAPSRLGREPAAYAVPRKGGGLRRIC